MGISKQPNTLETWSSWSHLQISIRIILGHRKKTIFLQRCSSGYQIMWESRRCLLVGQIRRLFLPIIGLEPAIFGLILSICLSGFSGIDPFWKSSRGLSTFGLVMDSATSRTLTDLMELLPDPFCRGCNTHPSYDRFAEEIQE